MGKVTELGYATKVNFLKYMSVCSSCACIYCMYMCVNVYTLWRRIYVWMHVCIFTSTSMITEVWVCLSWTLIFPFRLRVQLGDNSAYFPTTTRCRSLPHNRLGVWHLHVNTCIWFVCFVFCLFLSVLIVSPFCSN